MMSELMSERWMSSQCCRWIRHFHQVPLLNSEDCGRDFPFLVDIGACLDLTLVSEAEVLTQDETAQHHGRFVVVELELLNSLTTLKRLVKPAVVSRCWNWYPS